MTADNPLNIGVPLMYMTVTLVFQLTLVSLVMSQLVLSMRRLARRDPLTGLLNRRAIDDLLDDEAHRASRLGSTFSVLMLDVDHFKAINDHHGHAAGDRALQHLATLLSGQMRDIDRVARYGGEEFVVLLPATDAAEAAVLAERLRERVASLPASWEDQAMPLTISIGVAQWSGEKEGLRALLAQADDALYRAKSRGRNCVEGLSLPLAAVPAAGA
jgi:diguanylate cyclase (GGDEF)-like protein